MEKTKDTRGFAYMRLSNYETGQESNKTVAYIRIANKGEWGVNNQTEAIKNYLASKNKILDDIYIDNGYSGINNDRPEFKRLLNDIKKGIINEIYVKDFARISRDISMATYYVNNYFPLHNVKIYSIDDQNNRLKNFTDLFFLKEKNLKNINENIDKKRSKKEMER